MRANYTNLKKNIHETTVYLEKFLRNLLLGEKNELKNRYLHVSGAFGEEKPIIETEKPSIDKEKPIIDLINKLSYTEHTKQNILTVYRKLKDCEIFGRGDICKATDLGMTAAGDLLHKLIYAEMIAPVTGHGKGKYKFTI